MKYILAAILFLIYSFSFAQDTLLVQPGKHIIDGSIITAYTNKWNVYVTDSTGDNKLVRIWTDYAQILEINGIDYLHRVQDLYNANYELENTWINVVEHKTLLPKRFSNHSTTGYLNLLKFSEGKIVSSSNQNKEKEFRTNSYNINTLVYDWNLYGILLTGLPFEQNAIYKIPFWEENGATAGYVISKVEGQETVSTLSGKKIGTYKFSTDKGLTFWLTKENPYVIRLELKMPNGSTMIWKMY